MRVENGGVAVNNFAIEQESVWQKDAKVSSFALAMIALFFVGTAFVGYGLSSMPSVVMTGFSFVYQLAAMHFMMIGLSIFAIACMVRLGAFCRCDSRG